MTSPISFVSAKGLIPHIIGIVVQDRYVLVIIREGSKFMRWGMVQHLLQIRISIANDLIHTNDFIRVPLFSLRIPKNSKSKIFRPPK